MKVAVFPMVGYGQNEPTPGPRACEKSCNVKKCVERRKTSFVVKEIRFVWKNIVTFIFGKDEVQLQRSTGKLA